MLKNAIKFTPAGGDVIARSTNSAENRLRIEVSDTGAGIAPAFLPSIFDPFAQGDRQTAGAISGLGLGLSIAKTVIELHGGTIAAQSEGVGRGATFSVELATDSSVTAAASAAGAQPAASRRRYHLLVVEDHQPTREVLERLLRRQGHAVESASSVEAALARAAAGRFDLVISDIGLPDGDGVELMVQLTRNYGLRGIALSGYGMTEDLARTKDAGFLAHLVKPIDFERLSQVIETVGEAA
jgi:CheY-like chemotaxis protein